MEEKNQINFFTMKDVWDSIKNTEPIDVRKKYDPLMFWDDFGDRYLKSFKKPQEVSKYTPYLISRLKSLNVETLLDAGCGFCRIEPFLLDSEAVKEITAIDISQKQLDAAEVYLKDYKLADKVHIKHRTIKWSNEPGDQYDCVISIECLQHMHLPSVRYAVKQIQKLTKKYAIIIERFVYTEEHPAPHLWSHDYTSLFTYAGMKVLENKIIDNGVIALVLEK